MNVEKTVWIIAVCMIISLTVANVGQFITIRVIVKNHQAQLVQIQQSINLTHQQNQQILNQQNQRIDRLIGQLKAAKTMEDVEKALETIQ